jgi:Ca2+-binding EF-hand superfamily protein
MSKSERSVVPQQVSAVIQKRVGQMLAVSILAVLSFGASAEESDEREALIKTLRQVHANYQSADEDGDGNLTMRQFRVFIDANAEIDFARASQVKRMRAYRPAFLAVDLNNDGSLSWQEYVTVLRNAGNAAR